MNRTDRAVQLLKAMSTVFGATTSTATDVIELLVHTTMLASLQTTDPGAFLQEAVRMLLKADAMRPSVAAIMAAGGPGALSKGGKS